jgi:hypothetical protein
VYVDKGWQEVSSEFGEPITDCKKKWRHLRSSLSRYLKSSKDSSKNKNNKLKPYYLLTHMDFLIPYTKTLDVSLKSEPDEHQVGYTSDMKSDEDPGSYDHEIIQEDESQNMEEDDIVAYETFEIHENQASNPQKSQITLVRSTGNAQSSVAHQLQPITMQQSKPQNNIAQIVQQQHQIQAQPQQQTHMQTTQQAIPLQSQIIPIQDDQSSADLNFFLALMPDIKTMNQEQKRKLRIGTLKLIDDILGNS